MKTAEAALIVSSCAGGVALFGAINAYRALRWQRHRDLERRAVRLRLLVEHFAGVALEDLPADDPSVRYRLTISVVNESEEATVYLRSASLAEANGGGQMFLAYLEPDVRLEPLQRIVYKATADELGDLELDDGFFATAEITTGETFNSEVQHLHPGLLAVISEGFRPS